MSNLPHACAPYADLPSCMSTMTLSKREEKYCVRRFDKKMKNIFLNNKLKGGHNFTISSKDKKYFLTLMVLDKVILYVQGGAATPRSRPR